MERMRALVLAGLLLVLPVMAAAITVYSSSGKIITYYVPHNSPNCRTSIEGCIETSRPGLTGVRKPTCLDAVRLGEAQYVTLASDSSNYGKYYSIGTITYRSALDNQMYTVNNVIGYVHDTGGAFRGRPDKLDVCTTVCSACNDAQAGAYAQGRNVALVSSRDGITDPRLLSSSGYSPFGLMTNPSVGAFPAQLAHASQPAYGSFGGGALSQYAMTPTSVSGIPSIGQSSQQPVFNQGNLVTEVQGGPTASAIIVRPKNATPGNPVTVTWTSVNMKANSCKVLRGDTTFATGSEGAKMDSLPSSGNVSYVLECTTPKGEVTRSTASVTF